MQPSTLSDEDLSESLKNHKEALEAFRKGGQPDLNKVLDRLYPGTKPAPPTSNSGAK
jgi:hypothetical protein